mgnify:CR=1 FL=1
MLAALTRQPLYPAIFGCLVLVAWAVPHAIVSASAPLRPDKSVCNCSPDITPASALELADAVFQARVVAVELDQFDWERGSEQRYSLAVQRVWKGELKPSIALFTVANVCGRRLSVEQDYLFYASVDDGQLSDTACSRTRLASTADEDLAVLGPGRSVTKADQTLAPRNHEAPRIAPPAPPSLQTPPTVRRGCTVGTTSSASLLVVLALALVAMRRPPRSQRGSQSPEFPGKI